MKRSELETSVSLKSLLLVSLISVMNLRKVDQTSFPSLHLQLHRSLNFGASSSLHFPATSIIPSTTNMDYITINPIDYRKL